MESRNQNDKGVGADYDYDLSLTAMMTGCDLIWSEKAGIGTDIAGDLQQMVKGLAKVSLVPS